MATATGCSSRAPAPVTDEAAAAKPSPRALIALDFARDHTFGTAKLAALGARPDVGTLSLAYTRVDDAALAHLRSFASLKRLVLRETSVTDAGMVHVAKLRALEEVDLMHTGVGASGVATLKAALPDLTIRWEAPRAIIAAQGATFWSHGHLCLGSRCAHIDRGNTKAGRWDSSCRRAREVNPLDDTLRVARFDATRRVVHLTLDDFAGDEDPPKRQVVLLDDGQGDLMEIFDGYLGTYGTMPLKFTGDATARYTTDDWTAYEDYANEITEVVLALQGSPPKLVKTRAIGSGTFIDPDQLAACPFVDVRRADGSYRRVGEILRHLRGRQARAEQGLALGDVEAQGVLHVRLSEEKRERTFLDELWLEADGRRLDARECARGHSWCASGGAPWIMGPGDTLEVSFRLDGQARDLVLKARGYYAPLPDPARSR